MQILKLFPNDVNEQTSQHLGAMSFKDSRGIMIRANICSAILTGKKDSGPPEDAPSSALSRLE